MPTSACHAADDTAMRMPFDDVQLFFDDVDDDVEFGAAPTKRRSFDRVRRTSSSLFVARATKWKGAMQMRARAPVLHDVGDPRGRLGARKLALQNSVRAKLVEERAHRPLIATGTRAYPSFSIVIDEDT